MKTNWLRIMSGIIMIIGTAFFFSTLIYGPKSYLGQVPLNLGFGTFCMGWIGFVVDEILDRLQN